jgi:hypothetical protein
MKFKSFSPAKHLSIFAGTRQYGDDADAQKRLTQTQKCRHSTSSVFGVRLVGMQLYDAENEEYMCVKWGEGNSNIPIPCH